MCLHVSFLPGTSFSAHLLYHSISLCHSLAPYLPLAPFAHLHAAPQYAELYAQTATTSFPKLKVTRYEFLHGISVLHRVARQFRPGS